MREISFEQIARRVEWLYHRASTWLPPDIMMGIECAADEEENPEIRKALEDKMAHAKHAAEEGIPLLSGEIRPQVTARVGRDIHVTGGSLEAAILEGLRRASGAGTSSGRLALIAGDRLHLQIMLQGLDQEGNLIFPHLSPETNPDEIRDLVIEAAKRADLSTLWPMICQASCTI